MPVPAAPQRSPAAPRPKTRVVASRAMPRCTGVRSGVHLDYEEDAL